MLCWNQILFCIPNSILFWIVFAKFSSVAQILFYFEMAISLNSIILQALIRSNSILFIFKFYFVCKPWTESAAAMWRRLGHICLFFRKMAANGANDAAVRGFLHQLLHSIVRQIENNDGRGGNAVEGVLCWAARLAKGNETLKLLQMQHSSTVIL